MFRRKVKYTDGSFWKKIKNFALAAGREVIEKALWLYYAAKRPETPKWAKTVIFGALAYFISPLDALPDATPVLGYLDDLGAIAAAVGMVSMYIDDEVKRLSRVKLKEWFGK